MGKVEAWKPDFIYLEDKYISNKILICEDGIIIDLIKDTDLREKYSNAKVRDLSGQVILPGFVDGHTHNELYNLHKKKSYNSLYELMIEAGDWHKAENNKIIDDHNYFSIQIKVKRNAGLL